jgi:hypothetical protein
MKIRDILVETAREFGDAKSSTMPTTLAFSGLPSNNPYKAYRFAMAMANHELAHETGPADEYAVFVAYSEGEEEIISAAQKRTGERSIKIADRGSREPKGTNTASPIARPRPNRWGV